MKWRARIVNDVVPGPWMDCSEKPIEWHLKQISKINKPITINIICKNANTKREVYDWLFQRYNLKLEIAYLIGNVGGKEYAHPKY